MEPNLLLTHSPRRCWRFPLNRRRILRGLGVALTLPVLDCHRSPAAICAPTQPRRMLLISNNLGVLPKNFFPADVGPDYTPSLYLRELIEFRSQFTVFSGLSHPAVTGGHSTENCFLTSIRDLEQNLATSGEWEQKPKPAPSTEPPQDIPDPARFFPEIRLMLDMARLAFDSDSTRIVTLMIDGFATPVFQIDDQRRTGDGYHGLSHHLLDHTMVLFGSNLGDANVHNCTNLPILLAGGGLMHGRHLAFDGLRNTPLCNLFVTMLRNFGLELDQFESSTGMISELL